VCVCECVGVCVCICICVCVYVDTEVMVVSVGVCVGGRDGLHNSSYGMALFSRIDKIVGLFCKRDI